MELITANQIVLHLIGDYVIQSDWMAQEKTKRSIPALAHAITYSLPFLILKPSLSAFAVICLTHFIIDRFRIAKYICWAKNQLTPKKYRYSLKEGEKFGYKSEPFALNIWLLIICDNTLHLIINGLALGYL